MINTRCATREDLDQLAAIHAAALPNDLLPRLGLRFLRKYFFPTVFNSASAYITVGESDERIAGFCIFARDNTALSRSVFGPRLRIGRYYLSAMIRKPLLFVDLCAYALGYRIDLYDASSGEIEGVPEIFIIATAPGQQSRGVGRRIVEQGLRELGTERDRCIVRTSSQQAERFYKKCGFEKIGIEKRGRTAFSLLRLKNNAEPNDQLHPDHNASRKDSTS
jgi:ribosomal protein S18 acetylase RimI-like enzyme